MIQKRLVDLFVFDIAGTTVKDDGVVMRAFRSTLKFGELAGDDEWIRHRMGWNKIEVFTEALRMNGREIARGAELADYFTASIVKEMDAQPPVALSGAAESIAGLQKSGVKVAFNTGYSTNLAEEIIRRVGWKPDTIIGSDIVPQGRPAPHMIQLAMKRTGVTDPTRVGVAGDTPSDLKAGMAAGCGVVVGVGHGTFTMEELSANPCTHVLKDLTTLLEVLRVHV